MPLHADLVLRNGKIATVDATNRFLQALAARDGKIVGLGADHDLDALIGPQTRVIDLDGKTVVPGIVDSHCHPDSYAVRLVKWHRVGPEAIATRAELLALIDRTTRISPKDRWFVGYRLNERKSGGYPTLAELDRAGNGRPVFILRTDGHLALANSAAFSACGVGHNAEDPPFGRFDRDPTTDAFTGLVRETAAHIFLNRIHADDSEADIADGLDKVFAEALSHGITSLYNSLTPSQAIRAYQKMKREQRLALRMGIIASGREDGLVEHLQASGIRSGFGDDWLRLIAVEWCPDCSTSGRTAAYYEPYVGQRVLGEPENNCGMLLYEAEDLARRAIAAHKSGLLVCIEGVGDRGIDFALDAIEAALRAAPRDDHRMRVEHCCYVTPEMIDRIAKLGVVDSSATGFMYDLGDAYAANRGDAAMRWMWPHRTLIDRGIPAPGHSDFAVCRVNPWAAMWSMVTRRSESGRSLDGAEAITVAEALRAYTWLGAYSGFEESVKGSLELGKLADFVVLDRDIFTRPADELRETKALSTWVDGKLAAGHAE
jgi:predicted amidohydrolase YtcJ